jgi:hypothetical protein
MSAHSVAKLEARHALPKLIDFPDDVIAEDERRLERNRLRVQVAPDHDISVHDA